MPYLISSVSWDGCTYIVRTYIKKVGKNTYKAVAEIPCDWATSIVEKDPSSVVACVSRRNGTTFRRKDGDMLEVDTGLLGDADTSCGYSGMSNARWIFFEVNGVYGKLPKKEFLADDPYDWELMEQHGWSMSDVQCIREWQCEEIEAE